MKPKTNKKRIALKKENFGTKQLYGLREKSLGSNGN
jgi:hypothetical protein